MYTPGVPNNNKRYKIFDVFKKNSLSLSHL